MKFHEAPMPAEIKDGDRIEWVQGNGIKNGCTVQSVVEVYEEGVAIHSEHIVRGGKRFGAFRRYILIELLTKYNGKKVKGNSRPEGKELVSSEDEATGTQMGFETGGDSEMGKTTTRKSPDEMSESHRDHIEKWEPHLDQLKATHVWAAVMRVPGRGVTGPCYVAIKRGAKDYAIVDYDTEKQTKVTPKKVLADGFESSGALMETFKEFRQKARDERAAAKSPKASKPPKRTTKPKAPRAAKKATKTKVTAKKGASKKARKPAKK